MTGLAVSVLFVIAGLWVRRRYGGRALAGLSLAVAALMSLVASGSFATMMRAIGASPAGEGRVVLAMLIAVQFASYGGSALLIHLTRKDDGPWLTVSGFVCGMIGYAGGGAAAFAAAMAGAVIRERMSK